MAMDRVPKGWTFSAEEWRSGSQGPQEGHSFLPERMSGMTEGEVAPQGGGRMAGNF